MFALLILLSWVRPRAVRPALLFKVAPPRDDWTFHPSIFWHTADWESSTTKPRNGYQADCVLFLGDFDEINIHLLPRTKTVRVRSEDTTYATLESCGFRVSSGKSAYLFVSMTARQEIERFQPTIYRFDNPGLENVRKGEYIARTPQKAIAVETVSMQTVLSRWNIEICFVDDLDAVIETLRENGIYFDMQT